MCKPPGPSSASKPQFYHIIVTLTRLPFCTKRLGRSGSMTGIIHADQPECNTVVESEPASCAAAARGVCTDTSPASYSAAARSS